MTCIQVIIKLLFFGIMQGELLKGEMCWKSEGAVPQIIKFNPLRSKIQIPDLRASCTVANMKVTFDMPFQSTSKLS
jgi:hypothetical protein